MDTDLQATLSAAACFQGSAVDPSPAERCGENENRLEIVAFALIVACFCQPSKLAVVALLGSATAMTWPASPGRAA